MACYPQAGYPQTFDPTCTTGLGALIHRAYAQTICRLLYG